MHAFAFLKKHIGDVAPPGLNATVHSWWKYQWLQDHTESFGIKCGALTKSGGGLQGMEEGWSGDYQPA